MGSDDPALPPRAVLDANLLYPFHLRNLLVQLGVDSIIAPRWTERIHEEWIRNLAASSRIPGHRLWRLAALMNAVLPEAEVRGWEAEIDHLDLPDAGDRHVLAAAIASRAPTILTMNVRHFPAEALEPYGVVARHPDGFLCALHDADPDLLQASTEAARANLSRSTPSLPDYLDALER